MHTVPDELTDGLKDCWLVGSWFARDDYGEDHTLGKRLWVLALRGADSRHAFTTIPRTVVEYPTPSWLTAFFWRWCVPRAVR